MTRPAKRAPTGGGKRKTAEIAYEPTGGSTRSTSAELGGSDPADRARESASLVDVQRGERAALAAKHTRELAELLERQADEETQLEERQRVDTGRLWRSHGRAVGAWLEDAEMRTGGRAR